MNFPADVCSAIRQRLEQSWNMDAHVAAAKHYRPAPIRTLFIAESPPAWSSESKKSYFYFERNPGGDILFASVMEAIFEVYYLKDPIVKQKLLERFQTEGFWLIDAVKYPINLIDGKKTSDDLRRGLITGELPSLLMRLKELEVRGAIADNVPIVLIKETVFDVLTTPLRDHGFAVLNDTKIDFPKYHCDRDTIGGIRKALASRQGIGR